MRVAMVGHKAIPSSNGGIETVLTSLCPLLVQQGTDVVCYNRSTDAGPDMPGSYRGVQLKRAFTIRKRGLSAMLASFTAALAAGIGSYDVVHFHAEGPCAAMWIPKLLGKRCVATVHGLDWQRAKWQHGFGAKYIRFGERVMVKHADEIIVLSKSAQDYFQSTYGRATTIIPNGIDRKKQVPSQLIQEKFGLEKNGYLCTMSRLTPEKGLHYLIEAYQQLDTDKKLVICGDAEGSEEYGEKLKELAAGNPNIIFTGFVSGRMLEEIFSNCYLYCLPSDLEGMSVSLLEAMSYGCAVLCSDIPENTAVCEEYAAYFSKGDTQSLREQLSQLLHDEAPVSRYKEMAADFICSKYSWVQTADMTHDLYRKAKQGGVL